jgi:glycosyltransferase involved in cell wall biosynthesis
LQIPLVASWHTNFHEYAGRRLAKLLSPFGAKLPRRAHDWAQRATLLPLLRFYRIARATLAPTPDQVHWLEKSTGRPSFLMPRGVDQNLFHRRNRTVQDSTLRIGFVGRVTPEKGVRLLADIERALVAAGHSQFEIWVVGQGSELPWLRERLTHGVFPGILRGQALAAAYANLDLFVFPSRTDTYGNVIQEAAASGVPAVVTSDGGPKNLVVDGATGVIAANDESFVRGVVSLAADQEHLAHMGRAAHDHIIGNSWDAAFEMTYSAYCYCHQSAAAFRPAPRKSAFATL